MFGGGLETHVGCTEMLTATPKAKKKSRRRREIETDSEFLAPGEDQASFRTGQDQASEHGIGNNRTSHRRHHRQHARLPDASAYRPENGAASTDPQQQTVSSHRSRSVSRATGSASSNTGSSGGSSSHRRLSTTSKRDQTAYNPEIAATVSVARQSLTSSASAIRPSKQKTERNRLLSRAHVECREHLERHSSSNNNEDPDDEEALSNDHLEIAANSTHDNDWMQEEESERKPRCADPSETLPFRARRYSNTSVRTTLGSKYEATHLEGEPLEAEKRQIRRDISNRASLAAAGSAATSTLSDRPPSRQRHAFPTHLIDANGLLSQTTGKNASNNSRVSREKSVHSAGTRTSSDTAERPPSRYMTKVKRCPVGPANATSPGPADISTPHLQDSPRACSGSDCHDSSRLPSRRCVDSVHSLNQVNHDPKTDGFAEVDESVPPPFRIEITTNLHQGLPDSRESPAPSSSSSSSVGPMDYAHHRRSLQSRRWSSFSNQEQLQQMATQNGESRTHNFSESTNAEKVARKKPLEWFGEDDQINNAHLFETIVSVRTPRFEHDFDTDDRSPSSSSSSLEKGECVSAGTAGIPMASPTRVVPPAVTAPTRKAVKQISDQQWILASNNPFFFDATTTSEFDEMDPETAIAQTPLYSSDDLMTIATEMSDLHLDDFIMGELQPVPLSIAVGAGSMSATPPAASSLNSSPPLHTSLGKDFLSLFAQH